jgi:glycosyltransferase involved in cell wall biosynthesis
MRIAFLTPLYFDERSYLGGGERYPLNLAIGLAETTRGRISVDILSYGAEPFERTIRPGVRLRVMKLAYQPRNPLDPLSWDLVDAVRDADIVHVMQAYTRSSEIGYLVAKLCGKPIVVTDLGGMSSTLGVAFDSLELANRIVCYSDFGASLMRTSRPIVTIKGGVDAQLFKPPLGWQKRDRILYVGRLLPHKGIDRLIEALPADLPLTCCGRAYHADYFNRLQKLAEGKRVEFITNADDATVRKLYSRAWANVLPSVYRDCYGQTYVSPELMGLTLLEGMACGTPVICSRVGAMPEFIKHGETGFVFDTQEELTRSLTRLATEVGLADRMGSRARRVVEKHYDLRVCGSRLAAVYDSILAEKPALRRAA